MTHTNSSNFQDLLNGRISPKCSQSRSVCALNHHKNTSHFKDLRNKSSEASSINTPSFHVPPRLAKFLHPLTGIFSIYLVPGVPFVFHPVVNSSDIISNIAPLIPENDNRAIIDHTFIIKKKIDERKNEYEKGWSIIHVCNPFFITDYQNIT